MDKTKACLRRFLRSMENQSIKFLLNMKRVEIFYMWQLLEQLKTCVFCTLMMLEEIRDSMEKVFGKIYEFSNGITKEEF